MTRSKLLTMGLTMAVLVLAVWQAVQPARAQTEAIGIHKVEGAQWHPELGEPLFIALLGSDVRQGPPDGRGGRCDAIHILAINPVTKAGTLLNFPRDAYLPVPGAGPRKITEACFFGGAELLVRTLQAHTGLPIQYYVTTEFSHFMAFVDEVGGIEVDVPYPMNDSASGAFFSAGPVHMLGGHALAFTRNRKGTPRGDFSRTENQGLFVLAAHAKFRGEVSENPTRLLDYLRAARRHVKVTVPLPELWKMGLLAAAIDTANIRSLNIPGTAGSAGEASVVFVSPGDIYPRVGDDAVY